MNVSVIRKSLASVMQPIVTQHLEIHVQFYRHPVVNDTRELNDLIPFASSVQVGWFIP